MRFRFDTKIDDLNCISLNFQRISRDFAEFERNNSYTIDHYCQRQRCKQLNVPFNIVFLTFICRRFLRSGPSYTHCCRALSVS